jgi:hypothetical protein
MTKLLIGSSALAHWGLLKSSNDIDVIQTEKTKVDNLHRNLPSDATILEIYKNYPYDEVLISGTSSIMSSTREKVPLLWDSVKAPLQNRAVVRESLDSLTNQKLPLLCQSV